MMRNVRPTGIAIRQSPMNPKVWNVELECGHDIWVTRSKRPTATKFDCYRCDEAEKEKAGTK